MANFVLGKGTQIFLAMQPEGVDTEPVKIPSIVCGAGGAAAAATSIPLSAALPVGALIPANSYLNFKTSTGYETLIQLSDDAVAGESVFTVYPLVEAIPATATSSYPARLRYRTNADLDRTAQLVNSVDFESDGYERNLASQISNGFSANGNWSGLDAAYNTAEHGFNSLRSFYMWLELPKPRGTYTKGKVYKGNVALSSAPLAAPAGGIVTANLQFKFDGAPVIENAA